MVLVNLGPKTIRLRLNIVEVVTDKIKVLLNKEKGSSLLLTLAQLKLQGFNVFLDLLILYHFTL